VRIECGCLPMALGQAVSLSPEAGSGEADMAVLGRGILVQDRDSLELMSCPRQGLGRGRVLGRPLKGTSGEAEFWEDP
jgi:hypothetical protein